VVGDSEFGAVAVLRQLDSWGWHYVLRQKGRTHIRLPGQQTWQDFSSWITKPGQSRWLGAGFLTQKENYPTQLLVHWQVGETEPWCLATNLATRGHTLRYYKRRMWIEMFGDLKGHGFDLESTMLRHFLRLSRLTLAVVLLYVWLLSVGTRTIHAGLRPLEDRRERRDLRIFQIGLRFIERRLINEQSFRIPLCTYR
jgi:hypothetical protein